MEKLHRPDLQIDPELADEPARSAPGAGPADAGAAARQSQMQLRELVSQPVVQRAPLPGAQTSAPAWEVQARQARDRSGGGSPVDGSIRGAVERTVGADLPGARVHTGAVAAEASAAVGARAFTYGRDVFIGGGESAQDSRLMAHELTHVVQQRSAEPVVQRDVTGGSHGAAEEEADRVADDVAKKKPEIEATDEALGNHVAEGMDQANTGAHSATEGIHYAHNFKRMYPQKWNEDMWQGYADPGLFERVGFMDWKLKPGKSASDGIKSWLRGLTIAECLSTVVALQIDALRAAIGDDKFDARHGKAGGGATAAQLRIRPGLQGTPVGPMMEETDANASGEAGEISSRPAKRGEWYYFYNHPKYLLKHPGGAWQGENALCMGDQNGTQLWSGLGASNVTEDEMMDQMVRAYNAPRTDRDNEVLGWIKEQHGGTLPKIYDPQSREFDDEIKKADILSAPEYTIDGTTRKGGFLPSSGMRLDAEAVGKIRGQ